MASQVYREWQIHIPPFVPTLYVIANGTFHDRIAIERLGGGIGSLVVVRPDEARKLAAALIEAADYMEATNGTPTRS